MMRRFAQVRALAWSGAQWAGTHLIHLLLPLRAFWRLVRSGNLTLMRLLMAPMFFVFGASLLIDPTPFYESPAYFIMRAWASSQAWGLVALSLAILMVMTPTSNRYALKILFFFAALYWASVAFTVSSVNGLSGYTGLLTVLGLYSALIMARSRVAEPLEHAPDV